MGFLICFSLCTATLAFSSLRQRCSWLRVFLKLLPELFLLVVVLELWQRWPGLQRRAWSSSNELGKVPTITWAQLLCRRLLGCGSPPALHQYQGCPQLLQNPLQNPHSRRGCAAAGARLVREQTCPEMLQCWIASHALAKLLPEVLSSWCCWRLLAPTLLLSSMLGPFLLN